MSKLNTLSTLLPITQVIFCFAIAEYDSLFTVRFANICRRIMWLRNNLQSLIPETTFCEWTHVHVIVGLCKVGTAGRDTKTTRGAIREPLRNNSHIIKVVVFN